jgi:hypothetical protein
MLIWNSNSGSELFVNGMLSGTTDYAGPIASTTHAVNLGRTSENTDRLYNGVIDDARVYNRALSAGEALSPAGGTSDIDAPF